MCENGKFWCLALSSVSRIRDISISVNFRLNRRPASDCSIDIECSSGFRKSEIININAEANHIWPYHSPIPSKERGLMRNTHTSRENLWRKMR